MRMTPIEKLTFVRLLNKCHKYTLNMSKILISDEVKIVTNGYTNKTKFLYCAMENPH